MCLETILLFLIFMIISSSDIPTLISGIEYSFDENHNNYFYYYPSSSLVFIFVKHSYVTVRLSVNSYTRDFNSSVPGTWMHNSYFDNKPVNLTFFPKYQNVNKEKKGIIIFYERYNTIDINTKVNFYGPIIFPSTLGKSCQFSVSNLDKDITIKFEYDSRIKDDLVDYELKNPFKVCDQSDCDEYITYYKFKKGHSYSIDVQFVFKEYGLYIYGFIPSFSFYPISSNNYIRLNLIALIIYLIFLIL